jgi:hypothetical protein
MIILPGPPVARAFPVAMKTPLPILDPREMIFLDGETLSNRRTVQDPPENSHMNLTGREGTVELTIPALLNLSYTGFATASRRLQGIDFIFDSFFLFVRRR